MSEPRSHETTSDAATEDAHAAVVRREVRRRRRSRSGKGGRKRTKRRISARRVFYVVIAFGLGTAAAMTVLRQAAVAGAGVLTAAVILWVLYLSDRNEFNRSSQAPRAGEQPRQFTFLQQLGLLGLFVLNVFLAIRAVI